VGESKAKMLTEMAEATGLKRETVKDLMKNGWVYDYEIDTNEHVFHRSMTTSRRRS
jgi:hypothetical protein